MPPVDELDIRELILGLDRKIDTQSRELDKRLDQQEFISRAQS